MELARAIHGNGIGTFAAEGAANPPCQEVKGTVPADRLEIIIEGWPVEGLSEPSLGQGLSHRGPFDADLSQVGWMLFVATCSPHRVALGIPFHRFSCFSRWHQFQTAAHAAVRALTLNALAGTGHQRIRWNARSPVLSAPGISDLSREC